MTSPVNGRSVVVFAMPLTGHLRRLLPLVAGLADAGARVHVYADAAARADIERAGGHFVDLFAGRSVESADAASIPMSSRLVSFAGRYGDDVVREVARLRPALVVHDTFAVIGRVVAFHLGLPRINVCAGHNLEPARTLEALPRDMPVHTSPECLAAVRTLRERHGIPDASPFSYFTDVSPDLNVYSEPPEFLRPGERAAFEPLGFFGSLWPDEGVADAAVPSPFGPAAATRLRVYVSFGTIVWRYFEDEALGAMEAVADVVEARGDAVALMSLGGREVAGRAARLARRNVLVEPYVNQDRVLREASVYITHQGLNSTHEAIYRGVPMISYPFFWDQPGLAARCQELGLAVPLVPRPRGRVGAEDVVAALEGVDARRESLDASLATARNWELDVIRRRPEVIRRTTGLIR